MELLTLHWEGVMENPFHPGDLQSSLGLRGWNPETGTRGSRALGGLASEAQDQPFLYFFLTHVTSLLSVYYSPFEIF